MVGIARNRKFFVEYLKAALLKGLDGIVPKTLSEGFKKNSQF